MIYNKMKMDDDIFRNTLNHIGRDVVSYYTGQTDKIIVEPNSTLDGGKIYCRSDSWIKRGDIIKVSDNWFIVSHLSNLASEVYNAGVITACDVYLTMRLGRFAYNIPAVASKYGGNSNARGIIDDSVEGRLTFITGYTKEFDELDDNPCVSVFGKVWQIGNYLNVNNLVNVYCEGVSSAIAIDLCIEPIPSTVRVGDTIDLKIHVLNTASMSVPDDIKISFAGTNMATANGTSVTFNKAGTTSITITSKTLGTYYTSPDITVI
jgi:hypothetical protein